MRRLAGDAGLSAAQISRLESGQVQQPAAETLVAIARALSLNPMPLLILAGHVPDDEARAWLLNVIQPGSEVYEDWEGANPLVVIDARRVLQDPSSPREEVHGLAFDLFVGEPMVETEWEPSLALLGVAGTDPLVRKLISLVGQMTPERRTCLVAFAEDQVVLSRLETHREVAEDLDNRLPTHRMGA
jgi:transcriptional regulator with XRE-family HTH domain